MTKRLTTGHDLPHDVETVFAVLSGDGWASARAAEFGDGSRTVRRDVSADGSVELVVSRELPAGGPGFLTAFLPTDGRAQQTDSWGPASEGERAGSWAADIPGTPTRIGGTMRLQPVVGGSRYVVEGTVTVAVPLLGGKAEAFLADRLRMLVDAEIDVLRAMLAG